ncbi:MAG: SGNH/GDSL hydrolase family protein [Candidatus Margulisiibacteriota bacterium]|jgi:lysophospholipase L1-like esterase
MMKNKIIYCPIILLAIFVVYLYTANAFIYYRVGQGNLTEPASTELSMTNNEIATTTYVSLGDSLTAGAGAFSYEETYPYILATKMTNAGANISLKNFSVSGYKTQDLIDELLDPAINAKPDVVTLLIGVNDIHNHIGRTQFKKNYQYILEKLTKETQAKIYLINIPYIGSNTAIVPPLDYYFETETNQYNEIIKELATQYNLKYIDLNSSTKGLFKTDGPHYAVDSFHPSALGYKLWANIIYDRLNQ